MLQPAAENLLDTVGDQYSNIYAIISPPRSSSTAFARVFWEHPSIGYYCHEPFEVTYFEDAGLDEVQDKLLDPLDLQQITGEPDATQGDGLVIKEMPYQVWHHFPVLAGLAEKPLIFLIRDPRINVASRMSMKRQVGDNPLFPMVETGWELLRDQVRYCQEQQIPYLLVDGADFRNQPEAIFPQIFEALGLEFLPEQLVWPPQPDVDLDNLDGAHRHLYDHVLNSRGMEPDRHLPPALSEFPLENGFQDHVAQCMKIYEVLSKDPARVHP